MAFSFLSSGSNDHKKFEAHLLDYIIKTKNPSTIGPDELLTVRFPELNANQVDIQSTMKLTFNISLLGTVPNKTLVQNLGRNIIKKIVAGFKQQGERGTRAPPKNDFCPPLKGFCPPNNF